MSSWFRAGGSLGRLMSTSKPRCSRSMLLRCRPSMISILPFRAAKSRLAFPTHEVVTSTPLAAALSSITPAKAWTASCRTILL
jgi:hypothetical protein